MSPAQSAKKRVENLVWLVSRELYLRAEQSGLGLVPGFSSGGGVFFCFSRFWTRKFQAKEKERV